MQTKIFTLLFFILSLLNISAQKSQVEELGRVTWGRDLNKAKVASQQIKKPILILFQEIPGCSTCKNYGSSVLSHPLIVEAIERYFIPLAIHNNKPGKDEEVIKIFNEPAWNNPVVRIVNDKLAPVVDRLSGNYTSYGLISKINSAIILSGNTIPEYLKILEEEFLADAQGTEKATLGMYCFWSGEKNYAQMKGVVGTQAGFMGGSEVVEVEYNPKVISLEDLVQKGKTVSCADRIFINKNEAQKNSKVKISSKTKSDFRVDPELKYYIYKSDYKYIPMSKLQALKINSLLANGENCDDLLSPKQLLLLQKVKSNPKSQKTNFIGKDITTVWSWEL